MHVDNYITTDLQLCPQSLTRVYTKPFLGKGLLHCLPRLRYVGDGPCPHASPLIPGMYDTVM